MGANSIIVQIAGEEEKFEAFVELVRPYGILELGRTGVVAMARGTDSLRNPGAEEISTGKPQRSTIPAKRQPTQEEIEATPPG